MLVDEAGREMPLKRLSVTPTTKVSLPGEEELGREFAAVMHLDGILANINSLVRHAPTGFVLFRDRPQTPVQVQDIRLEIEQPNA
jgi:hypothetical protein